MYVCKLPLQDNVNSFSEGTFRPCQRKKAGHIWEMGYPLNCMGKDSWLQGWKHCLQDTKQTCHPHSNSNLSSSGSGPLEKNTYFDYNLKACHFVQHFHSILNAPVWLKKSLFAFESLEEPDSMRVVPKRGGLLKARKYPQMCVGPRPVSGSRKRFFAWRQF